MTTFGLSPVLKHALRVCWIPTGSNSTSMLAFEPLLPWDGGDNRFRSISCPKTRLACLLGLGVLDAVNASNFNEHARFQAAAPLGRGG